MIIPGLTTFRIEPKSTHSIQQQTGRGSVETLSVMQPTLRKRLLDGLLCREYRGPWPENLGSQVASPLPLRSRQDGCFLVIVARYDWLVW